MKNFLKKHYLTLSVIGLIALSIGSWIVFYSLNLTTIYNDAMSHLNVARLVVDNEQPGLSQLGSVWLPVGHILILPFVWNDFMWHTGLAGAIISMAAFVISTIAIYKTVYHLSNSRVGAYIAAVAFALNLNLLYLQSTALTEPLYLALFSLSLLFLVKYLRYYSTKSLIALAVVSAIGILTRYDAWFVAAVMGVIILLNELIVKKKSIQAGLGHFVLFAFPILFAAVLWLGWNLIIFGDPLYSFVGPYSARAQQELIEGASGLITKYDIAMSSWAYLLTALRNVGIGLSILGILGWIIYVVFSKQLARSARVFSAVAAFSIILFNVLALFLGFSILNLPELNWNPSGTEAGELFNVRYGILALPFVAVGIGLLVAHMKKYVKTAVSLIIVLVLMQSVAIYLQGVITIQDGQTGSSAFVNQDIATALKREVKPGEEVIISTSSYNAVTYNSGLDLDSFIHEGVSKEWNGALSEPEKHAEWLVMSNNDVGEPVYTSLVKNKQSAFLNKYTKVFEGSYASLYERK
jgi:hypothetical protein